MSVKKESFEILACRGCGNMPIVFDDEDYHERMYVGCMCSEAYCSRRSCTEERERKRKEGCRLNAIAVEDFDGKFLSSLLIEWNAKQNKKTQQEDKAENDRMENEGKKCFNSFTSPTLKYCPLLPPFGKTYRW